MNRIRSITVFVWTACLLGFATQAPAASNCQSVDIADVLRTHAPKLVGDNHDDPLSELAKPNSFMGSSLGLGGGGASEESANNVDRASATEPVRATEEAQQVQSRGTIQPISPVLEPVRTAPWRALLPGSIQ